MNDILSSVGNTKQFDLLYTFCHSSGQHSGGKRYIIGVCSMQQHVIIGLSYGYQYSTSCITYCETVKKQALMLYCQFTITYILHSICCWMAVILQACTGQITVNAVNKHMDCHNECYINCCVLLHCCIVIALEVNQLSYGVWPLNLIFIPNISEGVM